MTETSEGRPAPGPDDARWDPRTVARRAELLSDPRRAAVLNLVALGGHNVGAIARALAANPTSVSHALARLREAGAIEGRPAGKEVYYEPTRLGRLLVAGAAILAGDPGGVAS